MTKTPRKKPVNRGRNGAGVMGRPRADAAAVARAVELVEVEGLTAEEAGERVGEELGVRLGGNTVRRAVRAKDLEIVSPAGEGLELVVLSGMPASGKSTFARTQLGGHVHANRDAVGGTVAELLPLVEASLAAGRSVVVDNTLPTAADRAPFVALGRRFGARVVSVRLESSKDDALARNAKREGAARVSPIAVHAIAKRLEAPALAEGFDALSVARISPNGGFDVMDAQDPLLAALELPPDVAGAIVSVADADKARAVRRLVQGMGGSWDNGAVESLAVTWGCAVEDVRALVIEASIEAGRCVLPPELAREEAIATLRHVREKAKTAADWKSVTLATQELLKVQLAASEVSEVLTKAQFVALARRLLEAVSAFPGAREAAIAVLTGGG